MHAHAFWNVTTTKSGHLHLNVLPVSIKVNPAPLCWNKKRIIKNKTNKPRNMFGYLKNIFKWNLPKIIMPKINHRMYYVKHGFSSRN
jgi:hypothetical protein